MPRAKKEKKTGLKKAKKLGAVKPLFSKATIGTHIKEGIISVRK